MTTDNQRELFDIVDEKDNVIGQATRGEVHRNKNLIHRSVGIFVFNKKRELFLQQRSATKDTDPLKWTISCSGHVTSTGRFDSSTIGGVMASASPQPATPEVSLSLYEETAHRELMEELGVDLEIEPFTKYLCHAPNETEMVMLFKAEIVDKVTPCIRCNLAKEEIIQGKFFTRNELRKAIEKGKIELSFMGRKALEKLGWWILLDKN